MRRLEEILKFNERFVDDRSYEPFRTSTSPDKKVVILSCMDSRLVELLQKAMDLKNGDAKIIKNAGATIVHPFGSIVRSIIVAIYEFQVDEVIVVGHHGCGMAHLDSGTILRKIVDRGVEQKTIDTLISAGIDVHKWLQGFESVLDAIRESVAMIRNHPLVPADVVIHGLVMDPTTGKLDVVVNGYCGCQEDLSPSDR